MKLLIIRHGDPDYEKDSLTKTLSLIHISEPTRH